VRCGALYGSAFWEGCLKAFSVSVSAVSYLQTIKLFGFFIMFLGRLTTALLQFIVSVVVISVGRHVVAVETGSLGHRATDPYSLTRF